MNRLETLKQTAKLCGWWQAAKLLMAKMLRKKSLTMKIRDLEYPVELRLNNSDLVIFLGTFLHGDSDVKGRLNPVTIFDLGANIGITALQFHRQFPSAKIFAVEPDPRNFSLLQKNTKEIHNIHPICAVISHLPGEFVQSNPDDLAMSFQFVPSSSSSGKTIPGHTIADLIQHNRIQKPLLIKMDIEGAERDIFQNHNDWLGQTCGVLVEAHGDGTADLIYQTLFKNGFQTERIGEKIFGLRT
jgi:FkbM family methyltransferase